MTMRSQTKNNKGDVSEKAIHTVNLEETSDTDVREIRVERDKAKRASEKRKKRIKKQNPCTMQGFYFAIAKSFICVKISISVKNGE